jgi:RimJ/RimL family protein N-acetyltransferase
MLRDLTLRPLQPRDERPLAGLFAASDRPDVTRWFDPFPLTAETARTLTGYQGRDLYWGVWSADNLIAFAMVRGWDGGHPQPVYGCLVDPRRHSHGIGTDVTKLVVADLRDRRIPEVRARVHDDNARSFRMLLAAGFEELERSGGRILLAAHPGAR